ncbi:hypothetical protein FF098_014655 [Parvularcula flava]|uniref:Uncharacterized protein n=1 Tax=Aquisalinus luteolus TaxID=1566827 RepID=A0A8J3EVC5_9PROT|nr:hypothetical protein [Aquisalinus luteolus]NHK29158.1 hypothetical protein [Aquisalinus luteolus]GGI00128.1 hypothetical protein GCM10011355_27690 [Aquisalinus luteolus]
MTRHYQDRTALASIESKLDEVLTLLKSEALERIDTKDMRAQTRATLFQVLDEKRRLDSEAENAAFAAPFFIKSGEVVSIFGDRAKAEAEDHYAINGNGPEAA